LQLTTGANCPHHARMKTNRFAVLLPLLISAPSQNPAKNFKIEKLADDVYAVLRQDAVGFMVDANNVFIINDKDVVVVDANGAPGITREVVKALRRITPKPVRYVINTHWHDDHIRGNQAYRDAFAGVEFIGQASMRDYLPAQGAVNRKSFLTGAPQFLNTLTRLLASGRSITGAALSEEERASIESDTSLAGYVLRDGASAETILPTVTVNDRLTLYRGSRVIDIRHFGSGHTAADLVVHLPKEGIAITGDLVVYPIPLVGNPQSHIAEWSATLDSVIALKASTIVPGHGPILHDDSYLRTLSAMFASIAKQTKEAVARGDSLSQVRRGVNLSDFKQKLAGDSPIRKLLFDNYVAGPSIGAAYVEAGGK
jgi:glyoxylase-like metal-dependent hydrolase (beta-lactamase superfamily II)